MQVGYELAYESFLEHEARFSEGQAKFCRFLDGNFPESPRNTVRYHALAANTVASFVGGSTQSGPERTLDRESLSAAINRLRALSVSAYSELNASQEKVEKILPGLLFIDFIMAQSGHEQVFIAQDGLPAGLIVEHFLGRT